MKVGIKFVMTVPRRRIFNFNITIIGAGAQGYGGTVTAGYGGWGGAAASPVTV